MSLETAKKCHEFNSGIRANQASSRNTSQKCGYLQNATLAHTCGCRRTAATTAVATRSCPTRTPKKNLREISYNSLRTHPDLQVPYTKMRLGYAARFYLCCKTNKTSQHKDRSKSERGGEEAGVAVQSRCPTKRGERGGSRENMERSHVYFRLSGELGQDTLFECSRTCPVLRPTPTTGRI